MKRWSRGQEQDRGRVLEESRMKTVARMEEEVGNGNYALTMARAMGRVEANTAWLTETMRDEVIPEIRHHDRSIIRNGLIIRGVLLLLAALTAAGLVLDPSIFHKLVSKLF